MKKIILTLFLIIFILPLNSQDLFRIDKFEAWQPNYIKNANGSPEGIRTDQSWQKWCETRIKNGDLGTSTKNIWYANSDRDDNYTYKTPAYNERTNIKLSFGERVIIAKIQDGFALVFKDATANNFNKSINKSARFLGWVPIENLLLWQQCPKSRSQIYNKALVVWDAASSDAGFKAQTNPPYIFNPSNPQKVSGREAKDLDILYIMKKVVVDQHTYYLLSNDPICRDVSTMLYGWLPQEYITEWDQRLTLEPSHSTGTVMYYKDKGLKPVSFSDLSDAEYYYNNGLNDPARAMGKAVYQHSDFTATPLAPEIMRLPIVDKTNNDHIFKVATMTSLSGDKGDGFIKKKAELQREIEELTTRQNNINVIFVIDATSSMRNYYQSVANALKRVMTNEFFVNPEMGSKIRFGVVLYRDYLDHKKLGGVETKKLTNDLNDIANYLINVKVGSEDRDDWEAMFEGLKTSLDCNKMGYRPDQSNFIILIGDAGNHPILNGKDMKPEEKEIANLMFKNKINFMAYQVNNKGREEYDEFQYQIGSIQSHLTKQYEELSQTHMKKVHLTNNFYKFVREDNRDDLPIHILCKFVNQHESESAQELTERTVSLVRDFYNRTTSRISFLRNSIEGGYKITNPADEAKLREALRYAEGFDENKINSTIRFLKDGGVAKLITYAPEKFRNADFNVYEYVLFFSQNEIDEIIRRLAKVDANRQNGAKAYQEAIVDLGKAMLGEFSETEIRSMDLNEMMSLIYGLPIKVKTTGGAIDKIIYLDEDRINDIIREFNRKYQELRYIVDNGKDDKGAVRKFTKNGNNFYWIPYLNLPGFETDFH